MTPDLNRARRSLQFLTILSVCGAVLGCAAAATPTEPPPSTSTPLPPTPTTQVQVPDGFKLSVAYDQLELPTSIATDGKHFFVTEFDSGKVLRLTDTDGDDVFDEILTFADGLEYPRGLAVRPDTGEVYVASLGQINALRDKDGDGVAEENRLVIDNLYYFDASHANNGIAFGPDGRLYVAEGAPRLKDMKIDGNKFSVKGKGNTDFAGKVLSIKPDGTDVQTMAAGFRNPFDLAFARDGTLYATDNGEDTIDADVHGDELNRIVKGDDYGYPFVYGPPPPDSKTAAPLINFPRDTSPDGLVVYDADKFPADFRGDVLLALFWKGRSIARAHKDASGKWVYEDFVSNLDRPIDLTVGSDGAVYIVDMNTGERRQTPNKDKPAVIYRVEYAP